MQKQSRPEARRFPHEETWLRSFADFHGTDGVTSFVESELNGISLVRVFAALSHGSVVSAEKCEGPGTVCAIEYFDEDGCGILVTVYFVSNELVLSIRHAEEVKEPRNETNNAA